MKKSVWYVFTVAIMLFGCSPKFQEFNDSGFGGGGFTVKISKNNQCKSSKKLDNQSYALIEDSINSSETILKNEFSLFITATSNNSFSKNNSKYKPVSSKKENRLFSFETKQQKTLIQKNIIPNKSSSIYHWEYFILGALLFLAGIGIIGYYLLIFNAETNGFMAMNMIIFGGLILGCGLGSALSAYQLTQYVKRRCLFTKIGVILMILPPIGLYFLIPGLIYDFFKKRH